MIMHKQTDAVAKYYKHTHSRTLAQAHVRTPSSCDADECEDWLSLAPRLSSLWLNSNQLKTLPSGVFSDLSALRLLVCLRECGSEWVCVSLSHTHTYAFVFFCIFPRFPPIFHLRVFELIKCLLCMHCSSWRCTNHSCTHAQTDRGIA